MSQSSPVYALSEFSAERLQGETESLADYAGKVLLIVNTASNCGFTPQYAGLEALYKRFNERGFTVLGFPCNQFGEQEPGTADEIAGSGVLRPGANDFCPRGGVGHRPSCSRMCSILVGVPRRLR